MTGASEAFAAHPYAAFLDKVEKPARYTGGEAGSVVKDWSAVEAKVCLAFPDVYDIGMSHLGFKILYKILNDDPRTLAERCYAPWLDLEKELRARELPLVSLESARPLRDFDVVGFSLQFELTYSNILTMLDLGRIPLRSVDRGEDDPLVIAGGPTATHPEPIAPFVDAIVIGDGEEKATEIAILWAGLRARGVSRRERLVEVAKLGAVYVPSLYRTGIDDATGLEVVRGPLVEGIPFPIDRALVDLKKFPFPDESPTGGPEAIFDRMSIEVARGCTEGCRFCQAGMIYRPVRERDPEEIVQTVLRAVEKSGQDEVSLTALSTADVSCISPLIKKIVNELTPKRISLGVSSLRAYGLDPDLLDDLKRVRATGLTFAPEAGSQRMRDVVNKNVTEEQLLETAERVFSRGFGKMKLYFMIGLPTEEDDDVRGIVETGARAVAAGKRAAKGRPAEVTVSVSTHVPKPHTPFQWAAMDTLGEVDRKQAMLRETARKYRNVKLRTHKVDGSVLEGVFARGDRRLADVLETAWKKGARFDSWDESLKLDLWEHAFREHGVERAPYLGTLPLTATLPWSHIDVGLEEGFLAKEYRKALQSRLSPPCGKVAGTFVHHTNVEDANDDHRRLVCYDCGVACDMTMMRDERIDFLERMDAHRRLPVLQTPPEEEGIEADSERDAAPLAPPVDEAPAVHAAPASAASRGHRYRFRFEKIGPVSMLGHLDLIREIPRVMRRAGVTMVYTSGFHPKPDMSFAPALSLGIMSLDEYLDVRFAREFSAAELVELCVALNDRAPRGLVFLEGVRLGDEDPGITKMIGGARYLLTFARSALGPDAEARLEAACERTMAATSLMHRREIEGIAKMVDVRSYLLGLRVAGPEARQQLDRAGMMGDLVCVEADVSIPGSGAVKASEIVAVMLGENGVVPPHRSLRVALFGRDGEARHSPLALEHGRRRRRVEAPTLAAEA